MNTCYFKLSLHAIMGGIAALFLAGAFAADTPTHKVVDGISIYLGVLPAEMILGHPDSHTEAEMHGGIPAGEHHYHVTVALFDAATGKRITAAKVKAKVSELALSGTEKELEPMRIAGAISYGNYFRMPGAGIYRIRVQVRQPGVHAIEAEFEYQHGRN